MAKIDFYKFHGTGNDFICIDCRESNITLSRPRIKQLCHRRFGVGADGLILLQKEKDYDFKMKYYNADGKESSMCGNGGRCIVLFAAMRGIVKKQYIFTAADGVHEAHLHDDEVVDLKMKDVEAIDKRADGWFINTGSPHHMAYAIDLEKIDLIKEAWNIRYSDEYRSEGVNVNFIYTNDKEKGLTLRTYERGVENETMSCGTGVTAAALVSYEAGKIKNTEVDVNTPGGQLQVRFSPLGAGKGYTDIWLSGPATFVYHGCVDCEEPVIFD